MAHTLDVNGRTLLQFPVVVDGDGFKVENPHKITLDDSTIEKIVEWASDCVDNPSETPDGTQIGELVTETDGTYNGAGFGKYNTPSISP